MVQKIRPLEEVGARRSGSRHAGGHPQKYFLDDAGRRLILAMYDGRSETIATLAARLHVPRWKVRHWGSQLGLARQKEPPWTKEDIEYLEQHISRHSIRAIAKHLGRTQTAIKLKAKRLGVNKRLEGYTMRGLCLGLGCDHKQVTRWIEKGWLKGSRRHTDQPNDYWYFTDAAIRDLVKEHPTEIDPRKADWLWLVDVLVGLGPLSTEREENDDTELYPS